MNLKWVTHLAVYYLFAVVFYSWGLATVSYQVFPFSQVKEIKKDFGEFVRGDIDEDTSLAQRFLNDFDFSPERMIRNYSPSGPEQFRKLNDPNFRNRRDAARLWISPTAPQIHRLIVGAFDFNQAFWGAILLNPQGQVIHQWHMNGELAELSDNPDILKNLYGVAFFPDGSAAFTMQEASGGIIMVDRCSRVTWTKKGNFHHVVQPVEDFSGFWTFGGGEGDLHPKLLLVDTETGATINEIDMVDVARANPETFIFDLRRGDGKGYDHVTHPNHIEPLPASLADRFQQFSAGDLLISYQATNLVFVLDPSTLKIKWWYLGAGDGPHDPDWQEDGTISLFNNNYRAERRGDPLASTIVSIDPIANTHRTLVDGGRYDFYSKFNGHHQITADRTAIITSSTQGRVFEVDLATGEKVFDFINDYDQRDGRTLHLSETFAISEEWAKRWSAHPCSTELAEKGDF